MCDFTKFYKIFCKQKAMESKRVEGSTRRDLEKIQLKLQSSANDLHSKQIIGELKNQIKFMDDMKVIRIKGQG
jgi:hypothetical protein